MKEKSSWLRDCFNNFEVVLTIKIENKKKI